LKPIHRYSRSGPACRGECPEGTRCVPSYDPHGPSAYECRDKRQLLVWEQRPDRDWAHTVDPRGCVYGLGCRAGKMGRRARQMAHYPATRHRAKVETETHEVINHWRSPWGSNDPISERRGKRIRKTGPNTDVSVEGHQRTRTWEWVEE
jgi:hypothetical protein